MKLGSLMNLLLPLLLLGQPLFRAAAETGVDEKEILIGSCTDLGSPSGARGRMQILGAEAYFNYVNSMGGVHGRQLRLISYDDRADPELTISCFQRLLDEHTFAGGFFLGTPSAAKMVILAQNQKFPVVGIISGAQFIYEPVKRYVFNYQPSVQDQIQGLIDSAWEKLHLRKIAVIGEADAIAAAGLAAAKQALEKHGSAPVAFGTYPRGTTQVDQAINAVRAAKPEAVLLSAIGPPIKAIVQRSHALGWRPLFMTTTLDPIVYEAEGTVISETSPSFDDDSLPAVALYRRLMKKYPGAEIGYAGLLGFMQAKLVVEGLDRAGKDLTREKYIHALESIRNFDIGLGRQVRVNLSAANHKATGRTFYVVARDGKAVPFTDWTTVYKR